MNQEKALADVFPNITYSSQYQCQNWGTLVCSLNWAGRGGAGRGRCCWSGQQLMTSLITAMRKVIARLVTMITNGLTNNHWQLVMSRGACRPCVALPRWCRTALTSPETKQINRTPPRSWSYHSICMLSKATQYLQVDIYISIICNSWFICVDVYIFRLKYKYLNVIGIHVDLFLVSIIEIVDKRQH